MLRKKRTYNPRLLKARHSYTFKEIAETFKIHSRTVQSWRKQGLKVIDDESKPYLVLGEEIRQFLKEMRRKRKHPLGFGAFFCTTCRNQRKSLPQKLFAEITDRRLGKIYKQVFIKGVCEVCAQPLLLFSSDRKLQELREGGMIISEHERVLLGSEGQSLNTDIEGDENVKG